MITSLSFDPTEKTIYGVRDDLNQIFRYTPSPDIKKPDEDTLEFSKANTAITGMKVLLKVADKLYVGATTQNLWRYNLKLSIWDWWAQPPGIVSCLTYDDNQDIIYGGTLNGYFFRWDCKTNRIRTLGKPDASVNAIYAVVYAQDLKKIIIGTGENGELFTYDTRTETFESHGTISPGETRITSLIYSFRRGETFGGTYPNAKLFSFVIGTPPTEACLTVSYDGILQQLSQRLTDDDLVRSVTVKSSPLRLKVKQRVWLRNNGIELWPGQSILENISLEDPCLDDSTGPNSMDLYISYYTNQSDVANSQHLDILVQNGDIINDGIEDLIKITWKRKPTKPYFRLENIGTKPFWTFGGGKGLYLEAIPFQIEGTIEKSSESGDPEGRDVVITNNLIQDGVTANDIVMQMIAKDGTPKSYIQSLSTASTILSPLQINDRITVRELVSGIAEDYLVKSFIHTLSASDESINVSTQLQNLEKV